MPFYKSNPYRSKKWLQVVRGIENCVLCGAYGVQAAHRNELKGMGMKTDDCATAAICPKCHHEIDNGVGLTLAERRAMTVERGAQESELFSA